MPQRSADQITLTDLTDGTSVVLSSESYSFPGTTTNAIAGSTTTKIQALQGDAYVAASVNLTNVTKPAGVTVTSDNHATSPTLTISVAATVTAPGEVVIPVQVGALTIEKRFSYSIAFKGTTGSNGTNGTSPTLVGLKNEAQAIPTRADGTTLASSTVQVDFFGYVGATRTAVTASVGSLPTGITVGTNTAGTAAADGILTLIFANASGLGGSDSGVIPITLTCNGVSRVALFSWAKAKAGIAGEDGSDGNDAFTVEVSSSEGLVFKNTQIATTLTAKVFKGGVEITGAAITPFGVLKWYKDNVYLTGKDGATLTIASGDVLDRATYEARLEY